MKRQDPSQPAVAGDSIKPGVERSGTPGTVDEIIQSPRSGRQRRRCVLVILPAIGRFAGSARFFGLMILGFRCAPPQALRCRPLPRAGTRYPTLEVYLQLTLNFLCKAIKLDPAKRDGGGGPGNL